MSTPATTPSPAQSPSPAPAPAIGGVQTVRRVITYLLLLLMVIIAAMGLSGLLERALTTDRTLVSYDNYGLAQNLAFALIAGPLAAVLWWLTWRNAASARDRASVAWPVYLVVASTVALVIFTTALFTWAAQVVASESWQPGGLSIAIVWALVWLWHYWMWRHPSKGPTRLVGVAPAIDDVDNAVTRSRDEATDGQSKAHYRRPLTPYRERRDDVHDQHRDGQCGESSSQLNDGFLHRGKANREQPGASQPTEKSHARHSHRSHGPLGDDRRELVNCTEHAHRKRCEHEEVCRGHHVIVGGVNHRVRS